MDIKGTLSSWGSSVSSAASSCGSSVKYYGEAAVEKGKLGFNKTVTLVKENPRTTTIALVAAFAFAVGAWFLSGNNQDSTPPTQ